MKRFLKLQALILALCMILNVGIVSVNAQETEADAKIKNIIYMIPDGGGMTAFFMAEAVKQTGGFNSGVYPYATPVEKGDMYLTQYWVGAETTHSANKATTDSGAGGTALATGRKTNNTYIGVDPNGVPMANVLEASQRAGKNTGIVVTCEWTNATPATFGAHDLSRYGTAMIAQQMVNQNIDVVLGSSLSEYDDYAYYTDAYLQGRGYEIIKTKTALNEIEKGDRVWSKFSSKPSLDISNKAATPTIVDMTKAAIKALDDGNENGFFLMVEGSKIDSGGHGNDPVKMVGDFLAFDAACKVAIEFAKGRDDTVVVVAPDHDTGGMYWDDANLDAIVAKIKAGDEAGAETVGLNWTKTDHTNWDGGVFIYAPEGVSYPAGIDISKRDTALEEFRQSNFQVAKTNRIDNTDLAKYVAGFIGVDMDKLTKELFVDVTDMGTYNETSKTFVFDNTDSGITTIKRNESVAYCNGREVDLDGEVSVYIEDKGRFYVPNALFEKAWGDSTPFGGVDVTAKGTYYEDTEIFMFDSYDAYAKNLSNVLVYKGQEVDMGDDIAVYLGNKFYVPEKAMDMLIRMESGEFGDISLVADCNSATLNVSGWVAASNAKLTMMAVEADVDLAEEFDADKIIAFTEVETDYNGDFSVVFPVDEEDLAGSYTFYMNYKDSGLLEAKGTGFTFKNTVPTMEVVNGNGDELMYMEQLKAGDTVNVTLKGFDLADNFNGVAVVAQYDIEGNLVHATVFDEVDHDSVEMGTEIKNSATVRENIDKIKVMYWNYSTLCPVFGVYTVYTRGE